jgi:hypothetical protein
MSLEEVAGLAEALRTLSERDIRLLSRVAVRKPLRRKLQHLHNRG